MNTNELKAELVRQDKKYEDIAREIGISTTAFQRKINNQSEFKWSEIIKLKLYLNLSEEKFKDIFFNNKVS